MNLHLGDKDWRQTGELFHDDLEAPSPRIPAGLPFSMHSPRIAHNNCTYKEVYNFMQSYGLERWTYCKIVNGTHVQQSQTLYNTLTTPGAPAPAFPCGLPS